MTKPIDILEEEGLINQDELAQRLNEKKIESMTNEQLDIEIARTQEDEIEQWKKKVGRISTRNRTMY